MMLQKTKYERIFLALIALLSWLALGMQLYLIISNRTLSVVATVVTYFSFFTILTNLIVAVSSTSLLLWRNAFFSKPSTLTAITVYIVIVGIVYNSVLRFLWNPTGLQQLTDELLHLVIPVLFFLFWAFFVPKMHLKWKDAFPWLIYPALYIIYIVIRGEITNLYPYPFVDVGILGYKKALLNTAELVAAFLGLSLLLIAMGKLMGRGKRIPED